MDTNELSNALREATDDLQPRPDFAADVLRGAHRRRSRNRFTIGAALVTTAAVAVAAVTVLPKDLAAPPPADRPADEFSMLDRSGGNLVDDENVTRAAILGWQDGIAGNVGEAAGISPGQLHGDPHVFWAGRIMLYNTPTDFVATIVAQEATLSDGTRTVVSGAVIDDPTDGRPDELELVGVTPRPAGFLLPGGRTLLVPRSESRPELYVSRAITVNDEGQSVRRLWSSFSDEQLSPKETGMTIDLPDLVSPHSLRIAIGSPEGRDGFLPVVLPPDTRPIEDRGLPWPAETLHVPEARDLPRPAWEIFRDGLRGSGLLYPDSYAPGEPQWTVAAHLPDGRTLILSEHQELDNPAYVFSVLVRPDGSVEAVSRVLEIDLGSSTPVMARAGDQGWVVAAWNEPIAYRTSEDGAWIPLGTGAALVPADAVEFRVTDYVHPVGH